MIQLSEKDIAEIYHNGTLIAIVAVGPDNKTHVITNKAEKVKTEVCFGEYIERPSNG